MLKYKSCDTVKTDSQRGNFTANQSYMLDEENAMEKRMGNSKRQTYDMEGLQEHPGRYEKDHYQQQRIKTSKSGNQSQNLLDCLLQDAETKINEALKIRRLRSRGRNTSTSPWLFSRAHAVNLPERLQTFLRMREEMEKMYDAINISVNSMRRLRVDRRSLAKYLWLRERVASQLDETAFLYSLYKTALKRKELQMFEAPDAAYEQFREDIHNLGTELEQIRGWQTAMANRLIEAENAEKRARAKKLEKESTEAEYKRMLDDIENEAQVITTKSKASASELAEELRALTEHCRKMTLEVADLNELISEKRENLQEITYLYQEAEAKLRRLSNMEEMPYPAP